MLYQWEICLKIWSKIEEGWTDIHLLDLLSRGKMLRNFAFCALQFAFIHSFLSGYPFYKK